MAVKSWSVAGAARYAREARISTVAHLRTAPIARQLRQHKLIRAYEIHLANVGRREAALDMLLGGLGYRRPYPTGWFNMAELLNGDEARYLAGADLYVISPQMCDVVVAAAQSLTRDDLKLLAEDDLPSPTGLLVLPHPLLVGSVGGDLGDQRAFSWHTPAWFNVSDPLAAERVRGLPAVRIAIFHNTNGPVRPDSFLELAAGPAPPAPPGPTCRCRRRDHSPVCPRTVAPPPGTGHRRGAVPMSDRDPGRIRLCVVADLEPDALLSDLAGWRMRC